jgi:hypothetical protein
MAGGPLQADVDRIILPTLLQMTEDSLKYWMSMTCLYDPYWTIDPETPTLPICMFHVIKITPVYSVETSKKRIILFEPEGAGVMTAEELANQFRENSIRTIMDNSVKMPTTYNMEIIVPAQPIGRYITQGMQTVMDMIRGFVDYGTDANATDLNSWFAGISGVLKIVEQSIKLVGRMPSMEKFMYVNKNSLEAMAESCRVLCMKMWTGYEYKYVEITGMTHEKRPNEDDVFRASLTLQERPILSVSEPVNKVPNTGFSFTIAATKAMRYVVAEPLKFMTGMTFVAKKG